MPTPERRIEAAVLHTSPVVLAESHANGLLVLTLNRPKQLNALNVAMIRGLSKALRKAEAAEGIRAVVICGLGRAFCAGGDIVQLAYDTDPLYSHRFVSEEYTLDFLLHRFTKPVIAIGHGLVMGGGSGLFTHSSIRIVSEDTAFSMPETAIGFFPDVGSNYFLHSKCRPPGVGLFLALTGYRCDAHDMMYTGLGTHRLSKNAVKTLMGTLSSCRMLTRESILDTLDELKEPVQPRQSYLMQNMDSIACVFGVDYSLNRRLVLLERGSSPFEKKTLALLRPMCPRSLAIAHEAHRLSHTMTATEVFRMEVRIGPRIIKAYPDCKEGVRAILLDKDRNPRWSHPALQSVPLSEIKWLFTPFTAAEKAEGYSELQLFE